MAAPLHFGRGSHSIKITDMPRRNREINKQVMK
jgi:hypothetical protein